MYQKTKFARILLDRRIAHYSGTVELCRTAVVAASQQAVWKAKAIALAAVTKIAG
jgi:hypothetical protein